ncbi:MAG: carbohydrate-binding domain-containing protein [Ruminococcus sp.]|nr:carbohydrate-binding domain-containing protein [Ruminococcus sp.]
MKVKRIIAGISALTLMASAFSCGSTGSSTVTPENTSASSENAPASSEAPGENTTESTSSDEKTTSSKATTSKSGEEKTTEASKTTAGDKTVTTTKASGDTDTKVTTTKKADTTQAATTATAELPNDDEPDEKTYTAEISLGSEIKVTGDNVKVDGSTVRIDAGGSYLFSGKLSDGQIYVSTKTEDKVTLVLNGVDIACGYGPAIMIDEAKKCTVKVKEGSVNNLSDSMKDKKNDGVIFSNDTLRIKGNGTLNITANNAHGLSSDDDIIITNGIININSKKTGISANDDISISGGCINITSGTNGIKSKEAAVNISGGTTCISGGSKEEKYSVYAYKEFCFTGGYLYAAGSDSKNLTASDFPYVTADLGSVPGGTPVKVTVNGKEAVSFTPAKDYSELLILSQDIAFGSIVEVFTNGSSKGSITVSSGNNKLS